jgi:benzoyl-CoA reductase/2-hydroxyglutaryl-CoA dehydratase subunit BcrC/BadD/HgdB
MAKEAKSLYQYPEEIRERFLATRDLVFTDGHHVTSAEIWRFMTEEAPVRWPSAFDLDPYNGGHVSEDAEFFSGIKHRYLEFTLIDRLKEAREKGIPLIMTQGGQSMEPYFAAGGLPLRPGAVMRWARNIVDGLNVRQADFRHNTHLEQGRREITIEACNQIAAHQLLEEKIVEVDLVAPYLPLRCSDMAYLTEAHRQNKNNGTLPLQLIDFPCNFDGTREWSVEYVAADLRKLCQTIAELAGKPMTDEALWETIIKYNKLRGLSREIARLCWSAAVPPLNSSDFRSTIGIGNEPSVDIDASICILEEARDEVKERIQRGVRGYGLAENPARLFVCGACVGANPNLVDRAGGHVVSRDDGWSVILTDVETEGDPYVSLARATLAYPYELPTKERGIWTAGQVRDSKADGLVFIYNWGCNFQSAVARMVADIVKEKTGIPTIHVGSSDLGKGEAVPQFENRIEAFIEMLRLRKGFAGRKNVA